MLTRTARVPNPRELLSPRRNFRPNPRPSFTAARGNCSTRLIPNGGARITRAPQSSSNLASSQRKQPRRDLGSQRLVDTKLFSFAIRAFETLPRLQKLVVLASVQSRLLRVVEERAALADATRVPRSSRHASLCREFRGFEAIASFESLANFEHSEFRRHSRVRDILQPRVSRVDGNFGRETVTARMREVSWILRDFSRVFRR